MMNLAAAAACLFSAYLNHDSAWLAALLVALTFRNLELAIKNFFKSRVMLTHTRKLTPRVSSGGGTPRKDPKS